MGEALSFHLGHLDEFYRIGYSSLYPQALGLRNMPVHEEDSSVPARQVRGLKDTQLHGRGDEGGRR